MNRKLINVVAAIAVIAVFFVARSCRARASGAAEAAFDIVIRNAHVLDGTGSPWYSADIAIRDGRIAAIGRLGNVSAKTTIDAHGRVVAPGFIDMLGQSERTILVDPRLPSKIYQGITTEITGEGSSIAPLNDRIIRDDRVSYERYHLTPDWSTLQQYFARLEKQGMGINLATYVGATQVRRYVIGDADRDPTPEELESMKALVDQAMREGAMGVSTSLQYPPAPYAKTAELIALAGEASRYGGIYATHMRSEGNDIMNSLEEVTRIAREAKIPAEIWHIKAAGKPNWGRMPKIVEFIDKARASGLDISAILTPTLPGIIHFPLSFRRGRTMAATRNSSSACAIPQSASESRRKWIRRRPTGTTSGVKFPARKRSL